MATELDGNWRLVGTGTSSNASFTFSHRLYARMDNANGRQGKCDVHFEYRVYITSSSYSSYSGTWGNGGGIYSNDVQHGTVLRRQPFSTTWNTNTEYAVTSWDVYVSEDSGNGLTFGASAWTDYAWAGSSSSTAGGGNVTAYTAPAHLTVTNLERGIDNFSALVSINGWGGKGNSSTRYRELQVWTNSSSGLVEPRRYQPVFGDSKSSVITTSNSSSGSLTISPNTKYVIGAYSSNGTYNTGSQRIGQYTTRAPKDTLTLNTATSNSLKINYSVPADGGEYNKTLEYSLDGTNWTTYDTITNGNAKSSNFTISNLQPNTQYTIRSRVTTNAGTTTNDNLVVSTIGPETPTISGSNDGSVFSQNNITYGTTTFGGGTNGTVYLYGGTGSAPTTSINSKTTTGNSTYNHTGLTPNTRYYYRSRAVATFSGSQVWSDYSPTIQVVTRTDKPTITAMGVLEYITASTVRVRAAVSIPADGDFYDKQLSYRYAIGSGSYNAWSTYTTITTGSVHSINLDIADIPTDTEIQLQVRLVTTAGSSEIDTKRISTSGSHEGPTGFDFNVEDNNTSLQSWLSTFSGYTNPIFIQGKSRAKIVVPRATEGVTSDGATLVDYKASIPSESANLTIAWVSGQSDMAGMFADGIPARRATDFPSNSLLVSTKAYDSLFTYTEVQKNIITLSYENPTLEAEGERLNTLGNALINFRGKYARLQDNSLNSGNDINDVNLAYRVIDYDGTILVDWTQITQYQTAIDEDEPFYRNYEGSLTLTNISYMTSCKVEVRLQDHFTEVVAEIPFDIWDANRVIYPAAYDIELWDWKTNTFVADLSYLVVGDLNIDWELNDVEEVSFDIDLKQYEKKCAEMGVDPADLLKPYAHDIRIRRNGEYILGCQLVETTINISNNPGVKIGIKGTGFLNLFKDQYILNEAWSGYTYSEIARKLVQAAQRPDCLIKNPTGDIDTSYWLAANGSIASYTDAKEGARSIGANRSGAGWITIGTQMNVTSGELINGTAWVKGQSGIVLYVRERQYITQSTGQRWITDITLNGSWQQISFSNYSAFYDNGYIIFEMQRTDTTSVLKVDSVYPYQTSDTTALCNMNVALGIDTATSLQDNSREVKYELQNVKDALIDLTSMEDDNFDFDFSPDRTFNVYYQKGSENFNLEVAYPGNVDSMTISRSASNLANKIIALGSGIGDERLQFEIANTPSRSLYGTRESITTDSNISLLSTLQSKAVGTLYDRKDPTNIPKIVIKDGSVNPSNIQTGDIIVLNIYDDSYLSSTAGFYRVVKIGLSLSEDDVEQMELTVEPLPQRPEKKTIRYIRDSIAGNDKNGGNHWVEVEALMLVGNDYVNVAQGKTVYTSFTPSGSGHTNKQMIVNGNINSNDFLGHDANNAVGAVTIDLGDEYPIDFIRVWHYYSDNRTYKKNTLSVGKTCASTTGTATLSDVLWQYSGNAYLEMPEGRKSKWLQEGNIVNGGS